MRCALTTEVAACTAWSSASSGAGAAAGVAAAGTGSSAVTGRAAVALDHAAARARARANTVVVEAVLALQQLVDALEERARLRALDHAVVVGRGHRHDLRPRPARCRRSGLGLRQAGRVADRAGGDDRALARHQPRHRGHRADAARVGERDVARPCRRRARACCRARRPPARRSAATKSAKSSVAGVADHRAPPASACRPCAPRPRPGRGSRRRASTRCGLPSDLGEGVGHHRHVARGLHDRPRDQVGEARASCRRALSSLRRRVERVHRRACGSWWRWGSSGSRP